MDIDFEELTKEEAQFLVSSLKNQIHIMSSPEFELNELSFSIAKKMMPDYDWNGNKVEVETKEEFIEYHEKLIADLEEAMKEEFFDPDDDIVVQELKNMGADERLIENARSRVTPENIRRA